MQAIKLLIVLAVWGWLMWWVYTGSRAQGRARAMLITVVMLVLMALGVKF